MDSNVISVILGVIIIGTTASVIGCFALLRKQSLIGDAIAHSLLPGICLAFMLFQTKNMFILLIGAAITGWLSLLLIDLITTKSKIKSDTAISLVLSVFFGVGIMLLTSIQKSGNAAQSGLDHFLFGKAASIVWDDVKVFAIVGIIILLTIMVLYKELKVLSFDRDFAQSIGLPVRTLEIILATITVFSVAIGIQAVGVVLMAALLITPAAAARYWTNSLSVMIGIAVLIAILSGIFGAWASLSLPKMPTGPWIVIAATGFTFLSILFAPKKGWLTLFLRKRNVNRKILHENILKLFYHLGESDKDYYAVRNLDNLIERRELPKPDLIKGINYLVKKDMLLETESGFKLSKIGIVEGQRITRLHRLWELYLSKYLHIAPDHVHDDAEAIEHIITPEIEQKLLKILDKPIMDPHNVAIPYKSSFKNE